MSSCVADSSRRVAAIQTAPRPCSIREWGIGTESKVSVEQYRYLIFTMRDGRIVRVEMFSERADALEAAGLPE